MLPLRENEFLRRVAERAGLKIDFKDEKILPGTATIGNLPIDITIRDRTLILNAVGDFGGNTKTFARCNTRGKGLFRMLYPYLVDVMNDFDLEPRIWLTPLSPVWAKNYPLVEVTSDPVKGHWFYIDVMQPLPRLAETSRCSPLDPAA